MKTPKVTVIIPVYNHQAYIEQCLDSLIAQDFKDWEAVVVDDGSTDASAIILEKYQRQDTRIKVYSQKNVGIYNLHVTYNKALSLAKGIFIAVLEGDDYWPSDKLGNQIKIINDEQTGLCWGGGVYVNNNGDYLLEVMDQVDLWGESVVCNNPIGVAFDHFSFASNFFNMPTCSVIYRKDALESIGGFWQPNGLKWLDKPTWMLLSLSFEFSYCNKNCGFWRRHKEQITSINTDSKTTLEYMLDSDISDKKDLNQKLFSLRREVDFYLVAVQLYRSKSLFLEKIPLMLKAIRLLLNNPVRISRFILMVKNFK
jgi:glycosyltransferase involved in cell wall biosynthesis